MHYVADFWILIKKKTNWKIPLWDRWEDLKMALAFGIKKLFIILLGTVIVWWLCF